MSRYDKYDNGRAIHWEWFADENHPYHKLVMDSIAPFKDAPRGTVLDVGSGDGLPASLLRGMGFDVIGVEPEMEGISICRQKVPKMKIFEMTAEEYLKQMPDGQTKYDYLYSLNTIEHLDDPMALVKIFALSVKHWGVVVTDDDRVANESHYHNRTFDPKTLKELFEPYVSNPIEIRHKSFIGIKIFR
jgi:2-polyprenyl-3-methyl-5-hydroxy-6-metoxy-1,4-benzoquinol methylase